MNLSEVAILVPKPAPTQQTAGSRPGTPQAKQTTEWEHSPTHQQTDLKKNTYPFNPSLIYHATGLHKDLNSFPLSLPKLSQSYF